MRTPLPISVYMLSFGIFIMISCELQVLGMMEQLSAALTISIAQAGYLVSIFAVSMAIGGPILAILVSRLAVKKALMMLYIIFILGELLGGFSNTFGQLVIARSITGMVSGAFFGIAIGLSARLVNSDSKLNAISTVLAGIMLGTIIGLPLAKVVSEYSNWQSSFFLVVGLASISALLTYLTLPDLSPEPPQSLRKELGAVFDARLWWVFFTSFCIIGAVYAPFSYIVPILNQTSGMPQNSITLILFAYGGIMLIGNSLVAKMATKDAKLTLLTGISILIINLCLFALFSNHLWISVTCTLLLGLCGVSLNPAMVSRLMELPQGERAFVNTLHASMITLGIMFGSFIAGMALSYNYPLTVTIWVGAAIAFFGLLTLALSPTLKLEARLTCPK
ncbi:MFS transporter [Marinomonas rhizomae]|uniref:MFS transporter n=1 Tax=Marinomonas rhizomae TaxID=491948 RepID=UPI0021051EAC|nr:MFS transporter [Marinomonas rhizomae]UTV97742.1 MFS transporter [Marinomonas rhizomae]